MTTNLLYWVLALLSVSSFCVGVATFAFIAGRAVEVLKLENDFLAKRVAEQTEFVEVLMKKLTTIKQDKSDDSADWWKNQE